MKEKNLAHMGSLLGGVVHNLNTPLMWVMGRAQLLQTRNERLEMLKDLHPEEILSIQQKNDKDISSILEGADKIDFILKGLGYKIQMVNEGYTSVELKEFLEMEINFLMADMRFKHDTKREINLGGRSYYAKVDYNALAGAVCGTINAILDHTGKGRTLKISLDNGIIHIACPELKLDKQLREEIDSSSRDLLAFAAVHMDDKKGVLVTFALKDL